MPVFKSQMKVLELISRELLQDYRYISKWYQKCIIFVSFLVHAHSLLGVNWRGE